MEYYQNIRALCASKNLPIGKLESTCGFIQGTIARWSRNVPQIDKLEKVADVLGCSIDDLCGRVPPVSPDDQTITGFLNELRPVNDLSEDEQLIIHKFRTLPDADKLKLLFQIMRFEAKRDE